jgi:hypothetical protein
MNTTRNIGSYTRNNYNKLYNRWCFMHRLCYDEDYKNYNKDAKIIVCKEWHKSNPVGFDNFVDWILLIEKQDEKQLVGKRFERRNKAIGFLPCNMKIVDSYRANRTSKRIKLDEDKVQLIRTTKIKHPDTTLRELSAVFNISQASICRVLRHQAWK